MAQKLPQSQAQFSLYLLGDFQLTANSGMGFQPVMVERRKVKFLLAYLALHPDPRGHGREKLAGMFWGDSSDEQARASLRNALAVLRKLMGEEALLTGGEENLAGADPASKVIRGHVSLNPRLPIWVDVVEFVRLCKSDLEAAVNLYTGDLLSDCYEDWATPLRDDLHSKYIQTLLELTQQFRSQGEYLQALVWARKALAVDPINETIHQHIMFCEMARGNRSAAVEQYNNCVEVLRVNVGVVPLPETQALYHWIKQTSVAMSDAARITNLPIPATSFIGRKTELAQIKSALQNNRVLTITGPGGSGKTRIAIQATLELLGQGGSSHYPQGVWWVDLTAVTISAQVPQAVGRVLGAAERPSQTAAETVTNFLRSRSLLLILDNCEHLVAACAELVETIQRNCANVTILATSREALAIPGEQVWRTTPMAVPASSLSREHLLLGYESVALFVERAKAAAPFSLNPENADAVLQICRQLDGIPLAIELAAARTSALSPDEIAERLKDRLNLLSSAVLGPGSRNAMPRQKTLRALIDWSFDLLSEPERRLMARLAVFQGGFTLKIAESTCAENPLTRSEILELVAQLVAKSLLTSTTVHGLHSRSETRYLFLDTIRQYALDKLEAIGEAGEMCQRHLAAFLGLAEGLAAAGSAGKAQIEQLNGLDLEQANLNAALKFAIEAGSAEPALRMANSLTEWWDVRGRLSEGLGWLRQILSLADQDTSAKNTERFSQAQLNAARLAIKLGDLQAAKNLGDSCLESCRQSGSRNGEAGALSLLGNVARLQSEWVTAEQFFQLAKQLALETTNQHLLSNIYNNLGSIAEARGDFARCRLDYENALRLSQETGNLREISFSLTSLGNLEQQQGNYDRARQIYDRILEVYQTLGARWNIAATLSNMGNIAHSQGDYAAARHAHEESLLILRDIGDRRGIAVVLTNLGNALLCLKDYPAAKKLHEEGLGLRRALGDQRGIAMQIGNLGDIALESGDFETAGRLYAESAAGLFSLGDKRTLVNSLIGAAEVAAVQSDFSRSASLIGGIDRILNSLDAQLDLREANHLQQTRERTQRALDGGWADLYNEGAELSAEKLLSLTTPSAH